MIRLNSLQLHAVALMGATGTGKSALAMAVAKTADCSIICCDSMQLYKGLDIGTAKPSRDEQNEVPHFMVDCCELPCVYSAARWAKEACNIIAKENESGRTPLIVGGTGLYLRALIEGFASIPEENPEVREKYELVHKEEGIEALYRLLQHKDADMAARLKVGDSQRIKRALCVLESTGKSLLAWQAEVRAGHSDIECPVFVLDLPREQLREKLAGRFHAMVQAGWLDEVRWLEAKAVPDTHPAMRAVGYRQLLEHLAGKLSLDEAINDGITATRRYAKRQVTWFAHQTPDAIHGDVNVLPPLLMEMMKK
jgi:tRNA dimethylallyltransferase